MLFTSASMMSFDSNVRPEEEGIKTHSAHWSHTGVYSNVRPEEEGIKTNESMA